MVHNEGFYILHSSPGVVSAAYVAEVEVGRVGHESHQRKTRNAHILLVGKPERTSLRKTWHR